MPADKPVHAFGDDALGDLDAVSIAAEIRAGNLTRHEVLAAALARVEHVDPHLNAVQLSCQDRAREETTRDSGGPFAGVPTFVKDNTDVAGLPTSQGSQAITPHPAAKDGPPTSQFLAQGFVLLGKSAIPEFSLHLSGEYADRPPVRNPWRTGYSVGGSSSGAAALVASGAVPIAHGNDAAGSIRIPAATAGLVGLKTTRGRLLDRPGVAMLPINTVSEGVLTRTVRDTAHYLAAAEQFARNPRLPEVGLVEHAGAKRLRIGLLRNDFFGRPIHPDVDAVARSAAQLLTGLGHHVDEVDLRFAPETADDMIRYWSFLGTAIAGMSHLRHGRHFHPSRVESFTTEMKRIATHHPLATARAVARLRRIGAEYDRHFRNLDLVLSPVVGYPVPPLGDLSPTRPVGDIVDKLNRYLAFTPSVNLAGGTAIALPHTITATGLPGSIQLAAPRGEERRLLEVAYEFEAASPFPRIGDATMFVDRGKRAL